MRLAKLELVRASSVMLIVAPLLLCGTAWATTETASTNEPGSMPISATLSYQVTRDPSGAYVEHVSEVQLEIMRGGVVYSQPVTSQLPYCAEEYPGLCWPQALSGWGPRYRCSGSNRVPSRTYCSISGAEARTAATSTRSTVGIPRSTYSRAERFWGDPTRLRVLCLSAERDPTRDVWDLLAQAGGPLSREQMVYTLRNAHDSAAVLHAIKYWTDEGEVVTDADGNVWLARLRVALYDPAQNAPSSADGRSVLDTPPPGVSPSASRLAVTPWTPRPVSIDM